MREGKRSERTQPLPPRVTGEGTWGDGGGRTSNPGPDTPTPPPVGEPTGSGQGLSGHKDVGPEQGFVPLRGPYPDRVDPERGRGCHQNDASGSGVTDLGVIDEVDVTELGVGPRDAPREEDDAVPGTPLTPTPSSPFPERSRV